MRRRLIRFLPIVAMAVLVQIFAPVGAFRFVASAVADPLFLASVCNNSGDAGTANSNLTHRHGGCCTACSTGVGAAALVDPPVQVFVVLQRHYQRIVWLTAAESLPPPIAASTAQARAPPIFS